MSEPRDSPNRATTTRPDRSSVRVARRRPAGLLLLLLGLAGLLLLAAVLYLLLRGGNDNAAPAPAPVASSAPAPPEPTFNVSQLRTIALIGGGGVRAVPSSPLDDRITACGHRERPARCCSPRAALPSPATRTR